MLITGRKTTLEIYIFVCLRESEALTVTANQNWFSFLVYQKVQNVLRITYVDEDPDESKSQGGIWVDEQK